MVRDGGRAVTTGIDKLLDTFGSDATPAGIRDFGAEELKASRALLGDIFSVSGERVRANTLDPYNTLSIKVGNLYQLVNIIRNVHPDADVRQACEDVEQQVARFDHELGLNRDLYDAVADCRTDDLDDVGKRLHERLLQDFRRSGVDRDAATREKIKNLREELVSLGQEFTRNVVEDTRSIEVLPEELAGLPDDYRNEHQVGENGLVKITTDYPDYNPFMLYADSDERRRELYTTFRQRAFPKNMEVLNNILARRYELAQLLDFPSWAAYVAEDKMIKTSEAIGEFIDRVSEVSNECARAEYERLLQVKGKNGVKATEVSDWEKGYLEERIKREQYDVDSKEVRAYFEYGNVRDGILALTEKLFGIRFEARVDANRWHEAVEVLDVLEDGELVGRVYLDMHPRDGKFKHAALFSIAAGVRGEQIPAAALVCNFPNPKVVQGPALLEHDDVVTFFHEFGHLLHQLFARDQEWVVFSGIGTEWDFVEVPSQLFEEWAWEYGVLKEFAVHHETSEVIPRALVDRLRRSRDFGRGLWVRHQMFYAALSYQCHRDDPSDLNTTDLMQRMQTQYSLFPFVPDTYFQASFGHLDDYSALYYTYMWSLVIVRDLLGEFQAAGTLSTEVAARYRRAILDPGGSRDAVDLVRDFLGRDYDYAAYQRWLEAN